MVITQKRRKRNQRKEIKKKFARKINKMIAKKRTINYHWIRELIIFNKNKSTNNR